MGHRWAIDKNLQSFYLVGGGILREGPVGIPATGARPDTEVGPASGSAPSIERKKHLAGIVIVDLHRSIIARARAVSPVKGEAIGISHIGGVVRNIVPRPELDVTSGKVSSIDNARQA